jgi:Protein of unknown function (DUF3108)
MSVAQLNAAELRAFTGDYQVFRNGKELGSATISLQPEGKAWLFRTHTIGNKGLAGLLGISIDEQSRFTMAGEQIVALSYQYQQKTALKDRDRSLDFDWAAKQVTQFEKDKDPVRYATQAGALDRHILIIALGLDLAANKTSLSYPVANKGAITPWNFRDAGKETIVTAEGAISATKVERLRENAERKTTTWLAPSFGYLPVKIEQIEPDGETITMVLRKRQ